MSRILGLGAALGAMFALTSVAAAGDDTLRLDLRKSAKITLTSGGAATAEFTHDARAKPTDDDVEDVLFRYGRGYARGYFGTGYYFPHTYAWRAGYARGYYGGGYYGRGYYGGYYGRSFYYPRYYSSYYYPSYYAPSYYYAAPVVYDYPCGGTDVAAATETLNLPQRIAPPARIAPPTPRTTPPMPRADEPPMAAQPGEKVYPYDGPAPKSAPPSYRYNGDPTAPVPMPPPNTNPSRSTPKDGGGEGRVVKLAPAKPTYQAYGDNRRKTESGERTVTVKRTND